MSFHQVYVNNPFGCVAIYIWEQQVAPSGLWRSCVDVICPYRMSKDLESASGLTEGDAARDAANTSAADGNCQG
jgi:hypothetical protein